MNKQCAPLGDVAAKSAIAGLRKRTDQQAVLGACRQQRRVRFAITADLP